MRLGCQSGLDYSLVRTRSPWHCGSLRCDLLENLNVELKEGYLCKMVGKTWYHLSECAKGQTGHHIVCSVPQINPCSSRLVV